MPYSTKFEYFMTKIGFEMLMAISGQLHIVMSLKDVYTLFFCFSL